MEKQEIIIEPDPVVEFYKKKVDRALIRENLKLTVEQRIEKLMRLQQLAEEQQHTDQEESPLEERRRG